MSVLYSLMYATTAITLKLPQAMSIKNYLDGLRVDAGEDRTHQAFDHYNGRFDVKDYRESEQARNLVFKHLEASYKANEPFCITEDIFNLPPDFRTCYRIDFDLDLDISDADALDDHLERLVSTVLDVLFEYTNVSREDGTIIVLLKKPEPTLRKNGMYKHGGKLCFPLLAATHTEMRQLRTLIYQRFDMWGNSKWLNGKDLFKCQIIDECVYKSNGWIMYGSSKKEQKAGGYTGVKVWYNVDKCDGFEDVEWSFIEKQRALSIYPDPNEDVLQLEWIKEPPAQSVHVPKKKSAAASVSTPAAKRQRINNTTGTTKSSDVITILQSILERCVGDATSEVDAHSRTQIRDGVISYRFSRTTTGDCVYGETHDNNGGHLHLDTSEFVPTVSYMCQSGRCPSNPKQLDCTDLAADWATAEGLQCNFDVGSMTSATASMTASTATTSANAVVIPTQPCDFSNDTMADMIDGYEYGAGMKFDGDDLAAMYDDEPDIEIPKSEGYYYDPDSAPADFDEFVKWFNERHFMANHGTTFCIIEEDGSVTSLNKAAFTSHYGCFGTTAVMTPGCKYPSAKPKVTAWLGHPKMRRYNKMEMIPPPRVCEKGTFNTWCGFAVERLASKIESGEIVVNVDNVQMVLDHVKIICNHHEEAYEWFLNWLAQMFQFPGIPPKVAPILQGEQQAGKGTFINDFLKLVIGARLFWAVDNPKLLCGDFNSQLENKLFINIDEQDKKTGVQYEARYKKLITDKECNIVKKGVDGRDANHNARFLFTTNDDNSVVVAAGTLRFVPIPTSSELIGDIDYFRKLGKVLADPGTQYGFYDLMMKRDISGIHIQISRPITDAYLDMQDESTHPIIKMLFALVTGQLCRGKFKKQYEQALIQDITRYDAEADDCDVLSITGQELSSVYNVWHTEWKSRNSVSDNNEGTDSAIITNMSKDKLTKYVSKLCTLYVHTTGERKRVDSGIVKIHTRYSNFYNISRKQLCEYLAVKYRMTLKIDDTASNAACDIDIVMDED
jgi:Family of unknown function (DUF5906)